MAAQSSKSPARQKTAEEIISPGSYNFEAAGKQYLIVPMKERQLLILGTTIAEIVNVLSSFRGLWTVGDKPDSAAMMAVLPELIAIVLPKSSELIGASLGEKVEFIADTFTVSERIEALSAILEAEDVELLVKNVRRLMEIISRISTKLSTTQTPTLTGTVA